MRTNKRPTPATRCFRGSRSSRRSRRAVRQRTAAGRLRVGECRAGQHHLALLAWKERFGTSAAVDWTALTSTRTTLVTPPLQVQWYRLHLPATAFPCTAKLSQAMNILASDPNNPTGG